MSKNGKAIYNLSFQLINRMKRLLYLVLVFLSILSSLVWCREILVIDQPEGEISDPPGVRIAGLLMLKILLRKIRRCRVYTEDWYYVAGGDGS